MRTALFDYALPPDRIAQHPLPERDASRLLVFERSGGATDLGPCAHRHFRDLREYLRAGDCVVVNDVKVLPGRVSATKSTGAAIELTLLRPLDGAHTRWEALVRGARRIKADAPLNIEGALTAIPRTYHGEGKWEFEMTPVDASRSLPDILHERGRIPLPPYIKRDAGASTEADHARYQTVFARESRAAAAPTAGLHFTDAVIDAMRAQGVRVATVTLDVGWGTFAPIRSETIDAHVLSPERFHIPEETARAIADTRAAGGRVVAVGTTVTRTLETMAAEKNRVRAGSGESDLYVTPGYVFRVVDALVTNFHVPRSSLLVLVAAFAGRERVLAAYTEALARDYRFLSYGDACLILPAGSLGASIP